MAAWQSVSGGSPALGLIASLLALWVLFLPSFAWVIIGGLVSSTMLSRVVTPVMYLLLAAKDQPAQGSAAALVEAPA